MEHVVAVGTKFMLEVNAAAILTHLRAAGRASVSAVSKQTGLSRQAVTRSLAVLESAGLVEISAPDRAASPAGRPPQMVRFRAEAGRVLAVDVKPQHVRLVVADLAGEPAADLTAPLDRSGTDAFVASLGAAVGAALERAGVAAADVWHACAAAPGIVDPVTGHVTLSVSMPEILGDAILAGIGAAIDAPVSVDNDVKLATKGERWKGAPHAEDALVFIDWGERIGAGIVLGGELYRGASNDAGDLGYLDLVAPGTVEAGPGGDGAGRDEDLGPFERWVGTRELLRIAARERSQNAAPERSQNAAPERSQNAARERSQNAVPERTQNATRERSQVAAPEGGPAGPPTLPELAAAADGGADWALAAIRAVAARFAKGIAAIRSLLDPEVIVIGGDLAQFGPPLIDALAEALRSERLNQPRLEISALGADAIVHGAIHHALSRVERERFDVPALRRA
jgi:predicted NBD/HSP70 family sugar kinase